MRDDWGSTGFPNEIMKPPLIGKVRNLVAQDVAAAEGNRMLGFSERQAALGLRQSPKFTRPPEVDMGALVDAGS